MKDGRATVITSTASGSRPVPIGALSAMYSGYLRVHDAVRLGYFDENDPAVPFLSRLLSGPDPWCPFFF